MLTEPDMQARYVAAALGVIEAELRNPGAPAGRRRALATVAASVAQVAARLADDLERPRGALTGAPKPPVIPRRTDNVLAFRRSSSL
jgi:hypothetical protein